MKEITMRQEFAYGMRFRPIGPGCQPSGWAKSKEFDLRTRLKTGEEVHAILWYDHELTDKEVRDYELVRIASVDSFEFSNCG